jgi:hypothetical protein
VLARFRSPPLAARPFPVHQAGAGEMGLPEPNETVIDRFQAALEQQGSGTGGWWRGRYPRAAAGRPSPSTTPSPRSCLTTSPTLTPGSPSWPASHAPAAACWPPFPAPPAATPARGRIDTVAQDAGWQIPAWYTQLKTAAVPILGIATAMAAAARPAGGPSGRYNR